MKIEKEVDANSHSFTALQMPGELVFSVSNKEKALVYNREAQFQPVNDLSVPALTEIVNAMHAYKYAPCELKLSPLTSYRLSKDSRSARLRARTVYGKGARNIYKASDNRSNESV
jgi:hypothetical protein